MRADNQRGLLVLLLVRKDEILITCDGGITDHPTRYSIQIDENLHIEGTPESNVYLNHSCAPNMYIDWKGVFLRALRDIKAGEEITYDYITTDWEFHEKFVCTCGASNCYGEIKGFRHLTTEQQRALKPFLPAFMRKRIAPRTTELP